MILAQNEWISMQNIVLKDIHTEFTQPGVELGHGVLKALGFESGFTHMEWFRTAKGEAVFCEIGGRPPGALPRLAFSSQQSVPASEPNAVR